MRHFYRLKTKYLDRSVSDGTPQPEHSSSVASTRQEPQPQAQQHGLYKLAENLKLSSESESFPVDIIAVHGLNGDAYSTWTDKSTGKLWLRDFLPDFLPGCRVFTYGYPSKLFCEGSFSRVQEFGRGLLNSMRDHIEDLNGESRPIIFVCHSLGGIVCKQALVYAHENENVYGTVLKSTIGVAFLATPHGGSESADLAGVFLSIVNTFQATVTVGLRPKYARTELLDYLGHNSDALHDLLSSSRYRLQKLNIVSFYESEAIPGLPFLIVDRKSAQTGLSNEDPIILYENHTSICRFASDTSTSYLSIARALRRIARQSSDISPQLKRSSTHSSDRTFNDVERSCMKLLNESDNAKIPEMPPKPAQGTCHWIHSHPMFNLWLEKSESALLWLTGNPGCGKTILSFSLAQYFLNAKQPPNVLVYLCQNKTNQTNGKAVLISLIFQLINQHRSLIQYVRKVFDLQGSSMIQSFSSLWGIFLRILGDRKIRSVCIILDALDECEADSCHQLLQSISDLLSDTLYSMQREFKVKFLVTSRPYLHQSYINTSLSGQSQITIDDRQAGYTNDIRQFIHERVNEISLKRGYGDEIKNFLVQTITLKADHTFLWIHFVLLSIEKSLLTSKSELQKILARTPKDLEQMYLRYLSTIPSQHHENASLLLRILLGSCRPLSLDEMNIAFTLDTSHHSSQDVMEDSQNAITHTLQGILGPLVRISWPNVSLIHQSAKEFLLGRDSSENIIFPAMGKLNVRSSALQMAYTCIRYLHLDDFKIDFFGPTESHDGSAPRTPDDILESPASDFISDLWDTDQYNLNTFFGGPDTLYPDICVSMTAKYKFYNYAALYWAEHFARCEEEAPHDLRVAARSLLDISEGNCRNWLRFYRTQLADSTDDDIIDNSPLGLASQFNLQATLKDLLGYGQPSQAVMNRSLYWASRLGHSGIIDILLGAGAEPNSQELEGQTALAVAADYDNLSCVIRLLSDKRTDINAPGRKGRTALSYACGSGCGDIVQELLAQGNCNANYVDYLGATPFFWAVEGEHLSIISTLVRKADININHKDKKGRTAFSWAAGNGGVGTLKYLLKIKGLDANIKDKNGKAPLLWAAGKGYADCIEVLLKSKHVDNMTIDNDERNALSWASEGGHYRVLRKILEQDNLGVDNEDISGWTPLMWAIQNDSPEAVGALVDTGLLQIDRPDHGGRTALSWAIEYGHLRVVEALLHAGANIEAQSKDGVTPMTIAKRFSRAEILNMLIAHQEGR